jgi:hypothetical protein
MPESVVMKSEDSAKATRGRRREDVATNVLAFERNVVRDVRLGGKGEGKIDG